MNGLRKTLKPLQRMNLVFTKAVYFNNLTFIKVRGAYTSDSKDGQSSYRNKQLPRIRSYSHSSMVYRRVARPIPNTNFTNFNPFE